MQYIYFFNKIALLSKNVCYDTKLFHVVDNQSDGLKLQGDLDVLCKRAETWKMSFNIDKCKVLHYGKGNIEYKYSMCGQPLDEVDSEKDLGIIFSKNLKVAEQCKEAYTKANLSLIHISEPTRPY